MDIDFISEGFPTPGPVNNGIDTLSVTWSDLVWAAITVGRPSRQFVFQHGTASIFEALFRASALRMTLEQAAPGAMRLHRTAAARSLDPSEKAAVNYFLGLTLCKLFSEKKLNAPWLLHVDVFRSILNPTFLSGRSRPDLVGRTVSGQWVALESKGRAGPPTTNDKTKAKTQAKRIAFVQGSPVTYCIAGFSYFKNDVLQFYWNDPKPDGDDPTNAVRLHMSEDEIWRAYYLPIMTMAEGRRTTQAKDGSLSVPLAEADFELRVAAEIARFLQYEKWAHAGRWCMENARQLAESEFHGDGLQIMAGDSWSKPFGDRR